MSEEEKVDHEARRNEMIGAEMRKRRMAQDKRHLPGWIRFVDLEFLESKFIRLSYANGLEEKLPELHQLVTSLFDFGFAVWAELHKVNIYNLDEFIGMLVAHHESGRPGFALTNLLAGLSGDQTTLLSQAQIQTKEMAEELKELQDMLTKINANTWGRQRTIERLARACEKALTQPAPTNVNHTPKGTEDEVT